ncbi:phage tail length tape measure family protein [Sphingomonas sp. TREG-RG-20F-R18-01]|uniref:phage tail length tape measure family protein n=1 Tax=Sphingomonas sp. TREG-RG-20F-R18-01 TaxID=2914982 RepID=UPI001F5712D0
MNLVLKARDDATRALEQVTATLNGLLTAQNAVAGSAQNTNKGLADLVAGAASLDKAFATVNRAADRAESSVSKITGSIAAKQQAIGVLAREAEDAARAIARLNSPDAIVGAGRDQSGRIAQVKELEATYGSLQSKIARVADTIAADQSKLDASRSSLQALGSTVIAAADAEGKLAAAIAARQAAQQRANAAAGVGSSIRGSQYQDSGKSAENSASVFQAAGFTQTEKQIAAANQLAEQERRVTDELRQQETVRRNATALSSIRGSQYQDSGKSAEASASVFQSAGLTNVERESAAAAQAEAAAIKRLRDELNPLETAQRAAFVELQRFKKLLDEGKISAEEYTGKQRLLGESFANTAAVLARTQSAGAGGNQKIGLFGLKPYELQNLSYQVNDVVTGLASGQRVGQIFAQQGGQILQLFPKITSGIVAAFTNPAFIGAAVVFGTIALAVKEVADRAERLRDFGATLSTMADGATYSAAALEKEVEVMKRFGVTAEDASTALKTFVKDGVNPERIGEFSRTAKDLADTLGVKVPDAAKILADAFTGGYDAIVKLDEATNTFTAAQREHIRALFDEGRAQEARTYAYDIFAQKQRQGAEEARGPWSTSIRSLGTAWQSFMDVLAKNGFITGTVELLEALANGVTKVLNRLSGATQSTAKLQELTALTTQLAAAEQALAADKDPQVAAARIAGIEELRKKVAALKKEVATPTPGTGDTVTSDQNTIERKRSNDILHNMSLEQQYRRLQEEGSTAVTRLRERGESFLTAAEQRRRVSLAGELAATKAVGDERVKQAARAEAERQEREKITKEQQSFDTANSTPAMQTRRLIQEREGFSAKAYRDSDGRFRVGFGSDTTTDDGGNVRKVTSATTTGVEGAIRDLDRRIGEFQTGIKSLVGADRFNAFGPQQQAALTSVAYNYGTLGRTKDGHGAGIADTVRTGSIEQITAAIRALGNDNGGINKKRRNREADLFAASPNAAIEADNEKAANDAALRQQKLNVAIDEGNDARKRTTAELERQAKLQDTALIDEQIKAAGDRAAEDLQKRVTEQNAALKPGEKQLELTKQQIEATRQAAEEEARAQSIRARASAQTEEVTRPVNDLTNQRDALRQRQDFLRSNGNDQGANALAPQLDAVNAQLRESIDLAIKFYEALDPKTDPLHRTQEQIDAITLSLQSSRDSSVEWGRVMNVSAKSIAQSFASTLTSAIDRFTQSVAEGKNVFKAAKDAFLDFAASFLRQIAQMILQQIAFNIAKGILKSFGVPVGTNHTGGIAGRDRTETRSVSPAWFAGAAHYHTGGIAGLKADEVPAILQKGEEVLTRSDPRHRANGGASGGSGGETRVINVFDPAAALEAALSTPAGGKAILNHVRDNQQAWKSAQG